MIQVAIVEDDHSARALIEKQLVEIGKEKNYDLQITTFANGRDFIFHYQASYDLVLMDIEMPKMDGLSAAHALRKIDENVLLVFITNMTQYAVNGYEVGAIGYLVKPIRPFSLAHILDKAVSLIRCNQNMYVYFKINGEYTRICSKDITYLEVFGHDVICHTVKDTFRITNTLEELEDMLSVSPHSFLRIHRSVLINPRHVSSIHEASVVVDHTELPLSRAQRKKVLNSIVREWGRGT